MRHTSDDTNRSVNAGGHRAPVFAATVSPDMLGSTQLALELLEVTASGHPQLLDFQVKLLMNGPARSAVYELATAFDVPHDEVGETVHRACLGLDRLERRQGAWRNPAKILGSLNLAALFYVCQARRNRIMKLGRQRQLETIHRRVERAYELARSRAWIEEFIGAPLPGRSREAHRADR